MGEDYSECSLCLHGKGRDMEYRLTKPISEEEEDEVVQKWMKQHGLI